VRELLLETEMSLSEISEALGIEHPEYLSVFFKKETGLTPREYRDRVREALLSADPGLTDASTGRFVEQELRSLVRQIVRRLDRPGS
jgi:AraC-like DNA-binding protein